MLEAATPGRFIVSQVDGTENLIGVERFQVAGVLMEHEVRSQVARVEVPIGMREP